MHWVVSALLSATLIALVLSSWTGRAEIRWLRPLLVGLLLVRFAVPLTALASSAVYETLLKKDYLESAAVIERSSAKADAVAPSGTEKGKKGGLLDWLKDLFTFESPKASLERMIGATADLSTKIVSLIARFILETVVLPLVFLFATWRGAKALVTWSLPSITKLPIPAPMKRG
jgi:hypothetical protein